MIKKISIILAIIFSVSGIVFAGDVNKKIVIRTADKIIETEATANIAEGKIKIPVSLIKNNIYQNNIAVAIPL